MATRQRPWTFRDDDEKAARDASELRFSSGQGTLPNGGQETAKDVAQLQAGSGRIAIRQQAWTSPNGGHAAAPNDGQGTATDAFELQAGIG